MKKNEDLRKLYREVYSKGENKHFTPFITRGTPPSDSLEILKEGTWKNKSVLDVHGDVLLSDFKRRLPNVLRDSKLPNNQKRINDMIKWLKNMLSG